MTIEQAQTAVATAERDFKDAKAGIDAAWELWHVKHDALFAAKEVLRNIQHAH